MIVGMGIPEAVQTQGGLYFWKEDREVPDMWHVLFEYPKRDLACTFACSFHNRHHGTNTYILGRDASIEVTGDFCKLYGAEWKPDYTPKVAKARQDACNVNRNRSDLIVPPDYEMKPGELAVSTHMRDFIDCIRSGQRPRCDIDRAWEEAVTIVMSVEAYKRERKVRWDPVKEEIV
jgi:predicted dehydrogenase